MVNSLDKAIKNIILPMYDWIEDYEIDGDDNSTIIRVTYYVASDENDAFTVSPEFSSLESITFHLFNSLGLNENHRLTISFSSGVFFENKEEII